MKKKLIYWGIPVLGALIGTVVTIFIIIKGESDYDAFDNQITALWGGVIWFGLTTVAMIIKKELG